MTREERNEESLPNPGAATWWAIGAIQLLLLVFLVTSANRLPVTGAPGLLRSYEADPHARESNALAALARVIRSFDVARHEGETVVVSGYVMPLEMTPSGASAFMLISEPPGCCFASGIRSAVRVQMSNGRRISQPPEIRLEVEGQLVRRSDGEWAIAADRVISEM